MYKGLMGVIFCCSGFLLLASTTWAEVSESLNISADAGQRYNFNEDTLNREVWSNEQGEARIANGIMLIPKSTIVVSKEKYLFKSLEIRMKFSERSIAGGDAVWGWRKGPPWDDLFLAWRYNQEGLRAENNDGNGVMSQNLNINAQEWHTYKIEWFSKLQAGWYIDGELVWLQHNVMDVARPILLDGEQPSGDMEVDWIIVEKTSKEEPEAEGPIVDKLSAWLESGEGKTLIANPSFLFPPVLANGKPIYESPKERDEYYSVLGIWKKAELKEYQIKEINWVDNKLPLLKPDVVNLKALLPAQDTGNNLPDGSQILLKGKTKEGKEVPLIFEIARGKNRIINIAFSLSPNLDIEKSVTMSILGYIKTTGKIIPNIGCKAHTGYSTWQGTAWEGKGDEPLDIRLFSVYTGDTSDGRGEQKGELSSILFWSTFLKNSKPTFVGMSLVDEPIKSVTSKLYDKVMNADIIRPKGMCMLSLDYSTLSASYYCSKVGNIIVASTDRITQWLIETLDGRDPVHTDLFRLSIESTAEVFFLRPIFWVEKELIHAFKIEEDKLEPVPITVDRKILVLESTGGNYLIYYGQIKEVQLTEFWKKFCSSLKDKKEIEGETPEDYSQYRDAFNVHWVEF